jgi:hypothetical protein
MLEEKPKQTVPTGFSGVPPEGPAMPVTLKAQALLLAVRAPSAMALAHASLTAPYCSINGAGTHNDSILAWLE